MSTTTPIDPDAWPTGMPVAGAPNSHGEIETLADGTEVTHRVIDGTVRTWHCVTAGDPSSPVVVMLHGFPETWCGWQAQIGPLAADHFVIAFDLPGYGQTDKRLELDYDYGTIGVELLAELTERLGVERFALIGHDRGSVIGDHLVAATDRVWAYVRMQQSGNRPHSEPRPPHQLFASAEGVELFSSSTVIDIAFGAVPHPQGKTNARLPEAVIERARREFAIDGTPEGASASFTSAGFDRELDERLSQLFPAMTAPVLFLQGETDIGQQPHEYETVADAVADGELRFIAAGHFLHHEDPAAVNEAILDFLDRHRN